MKKKFLFLFLFLVPGLVKAEEIPFSCKIYGIIKNESGEERIKIFPKPHNSISFSLDRSKKEVRIKNSPYKRPYDLVRGKIIFNELYSNKERKENKFKRIFFFERDTGHLIIENHFMSPHLDNGKWKELTSQLAKC
jgi:hypothetical protein